jgi:hypothetical protein
METADPDVLVIRVAGTPVCWFRLRLPAGHGRKANRPGR